MNNVITILRERLDALHIGDVKSAYVPFDTLGKVMVGKIPMTTLCGNILVVSDVGLLIAIRYRLKRLELDTSNVTFLCHTENLRKYAQGLGIKTWFAPYNKLDAFFRERHVQLDNDEIYFLKEKDMKTFDVVCGNPPFQPDVSEKGNTGAVKIWHKFIEKAFELATTSGHLLFVTPDNWRTMGSKYVAYKKAQDMMFDNGIKWYINCQTSQKNYFPKIKSSAIIGAWHVQKHEVIIETKTVLQQLRIHVDEEFQIILEKYFSTCENFEHIEIVNGKQVGEIEEEPKGDEEHPYRYAHTTSQVKKGNYHWHTKKDYAYDLKKVFISWSGNFVLGYNDGTCGVGRCMLAYIVSSDIEGKRLETFLLTPIVDMVLVAMTGYNRDKFPAQLFPIQFYKKLPKQILGFEWDEKNWKESAKQVFGFTDEEIEKINEKI